MRSPTELTAPIDAGFGFDEALAILKMGGCLTRKGWNAPGQWVKAQIPDSHSKMTIPYLYLQNAEYVPWVPSQGDLFAEDWELFV